MTDQVTALIRHTADRLSEGVTAPPLRPQSTEPRRSRSGRWVLPAAAAVAVAAVAGMAALVAQQSPARVPVRTAYAGAAAELGSEAVPVTASGRSLFQGDAASGGPVRADLLARLTTVAGEGVLLGHLNDDGRFCVGFGYLPPSRNVGLATDCSSDGFPPLADGDIVLAGFGPAIATVSGVDQPPVLYGGAPPGTRTVELSSPDGQRARVPARDGGDRYNHRAYFAAVWDLGDGGLVVRALAEDGTVLAREERG